MEENRKAYKEQHIIVNKLIHQAKETYYKDNLAAADTKGVFQIINKLLNKGGKVLPTCESYGELSDSFANFFENKIVKIRKTLDRLNEQSNSNTAGLDPNPPNDLRSRGFQCCPS